MMNRMLNAMPLMAGVVAAALSAAADSVREDELSAAPELAVATGAEQPSDYQELDFRMAIQVESLEGEALKGLMYSANNWELNAGEDTTRTATITAQAGTLSANGVFTSDGSAELTVLPATAGEGTVDWVLTEILKKVYRLTHTVKKNGTDDAAGLCYGYLDFTQCVMEKATQEEVEAAVLGAITHKIAVIQDAVWPWQPIDSAVVRSGIATAPGLLSGNKTATTFTFRGRGVLHYEYELTGGTLEVVADGEVVATFTETTAGWASCQVPFEGIEAHEVSFVYTADGNGVAAIRNVRWEMDDESTWAQNGGDETRVDLREGVRTPKYRDEVLPFAYSSTNWIGVAGATAESKAHVRIVQMTGSDPAVTNWTTEVAGTSRVLYDAPGEDTVCWKPKVGRVWKAIFDILNGEKSIYSEEAWFDLRQTRAPGFLLMLK